MTCGEPTVRVRRIYEPPAPEDGIRVLVDRLWPRGMSATRAHIEHWCKEVAPSTELRNRYHHDPLLFGEFSRRYQQELRHPAVVAAVGLLADMARAGKGLTLLTATRQVDISAAVVLADVVRAPW